MSKFRNGDKVVPIRVEGYVSIEEWLEIDDDCCVDFFKENGYLIYKSFSSRFCEAGCGKCVRGWVFEEDELKPYDESPKTFTKNDLKDGMILTLRNGDRNLYICDYVKKIENFSVDFEGVGTIEQWNENLKFCETKDCAYDIMKVEYMGDLVWKREQPKEYLTLEEAIKTGRRFKHKDISTYTKGLFEQLVLLNNERHKEFSDKYILEQIKSKVWEIEE